MSSSNTAVVRLSQEHEGTISVANDDLVAQGSGKFLPSGIIEEAHGVILVQPHHGGPAAAGTLTTRMSAVTPAATWLRLRMINNISQACVNTDFS